ncbi:MAG: hypothetical protein NTV58_16800 [Deltaproteobacteria bacterium]|nr:hypothetical protein [Deltaproteobacteria bacterium]
MDRLDKRFGTIAVELGIISKRQLLVAMEIQIEDDLAGKDHLLLGEILMGGGIISRDQLRTVLTEMGINPSLKT